MTSSRMQFSLNGSSHKKRFSGTTIAVVLAMAGIGTVFAVEERAAYHRRQLEAIRAANGDKRDEAILGLLRSIVVDLDALKQLVERSAQ